jgi:cbb3-type cytochrome oxidase cytochrome c subunit
MKLRVDQRAGLLMGGVIFATFIALGAAVALPAADPELAGDANELSALERRGMTVYRNEGCWYCHTQYLRETRIDTQSGEPLAPEAYLGSSPAMLGHERIGPDLTKRTTQFVNAATIVDYLRDPNRDDTNGSSMPSYAYLGEDDLRALAAYLLSLR